MLFATYSSQLVVDTGEEFPIPHFVLHPALRIPVLTKVYASSTGRRIERSVQEASLREEKQPRAVTTQQIILRCAETDS